jgi:hypothetical protein
VYHDERARDSRCSLHKDERDAHQPPRAPRPPRSSHDHTHSQRWQRWFAAVTAAARYDTDLSVQVNAPAVTFHTKMPSRWKPMALLALALVVLAALLRSERSAER